MGLLVRLGEEVDPADRVHDAGSPDPAVTAEQGRRSLAGQLDAEFGVLRVQMLLAEQVGDRDDVVEDRLHRGRHLRRRWCRHDGVPFTVATRWRESLQSSSVGRARRCDKIARCVTRPPFAGFERSPNAVSRASGLWDDEPFLLAAYAFGSVLESVADVDVVDLAFVLNLPAEELPWFAEPQSLIGLPSLLEIDKASVRWYWRPSVWPVANHLIHRPLRVWSLDGPGETALDALERGQAEHLRIPVPTAEQQHEQVSVELAASLSHLRSVEADFWERESRQISGSATGVRPIEDPGSIPKTTCGTPSTATWICSPQPA